MSLIEKAMRLIDRADTILVKSIQLRMLDVLEAPFLFLPPPNSLGLYKEIICDYYGYMVRAFEAHPKFKKMNVVGIEVGEEIYIDKEGKERKLSSLKTGERIIPHSLVEQIADPVINDHVNQKQSTQVYNPNNTRKTFRKLIAHG